ncbi:MAG: YafY family transcriptional regulator [Acetobacteraceae bacterium]|nr:YafY family transcriptional regulator [Acetobacteraceae bacterium]
MRRADRLFDIIQILRLARTPVSAAAIAAELEVTSRTVYRDIATLQARRVPIEGAAGLGYVLRRGYELPPLMFTPEEAEAIVIGLRLLPRTGDATLTEAARSVLHKLATVAPEELRERLIAPPFHVSRQGAPAPDRFDLGMVREAIRDARKLRIAYVDGTGSATARTIRPIAMEFYIQATLICAWCELRGDFRHFRADRIKVIAALEDSFAAEARTLRDGWLALTRPQ